ncbi:MAG: bifunctional 5,10-methylenetetrahydrofolate dehydrogenase/5,10-methenyltetrahydrofolate cyclohydrolase [Bacteroidales bacterium]|nr:bifunctional 5,10-methylenetetrahydrofolate dehydrogenase/5,10-methenyltetrahydrofolate cyclohydrolase [Bacteroidales bacterium]
MNIIDGKAVAEKLKVELVKEIEILKLKNKIPHLAIVLVGEDLVSKTYVNNKINKCKEVGINTTLINLPSSITEDDLLFNIKKLNEDKTIDGYIIQMPLPPHINEINVINKINPLKDVDCFNPVNLGKLLTEDYMFIPATPLGIIELIKFYNIETKGKHVVVLGRSNLVGRPISILLSQKKYPGNATVTLVHSQTENIEKYTQMADILISAIGQPRFVKENMVKQGAVVIDVGTTRVPDNTKKDGSKIVGDVDFENVAPKCSLITPVPGGVGPMTVISLLKNTIIAAKNNL